MSSPPDLYSFVFRAILTEEALDKTARGSKLSLSATLNMEVAKRLPMNAFDEDLLAHASRMAPVYIAIAAFENSVRQFISSRMLESVGADWWNTNVSESIRKKAQSRRDDEAKNKYHAPRGEEIINYTEFGDLPNIVAQNIAQFADFLPTVEWMRQIIQTVERSRNVIMHSGELSLQDVERVGTAIRDWVFQVGA